MLYRKIRKYIYDYLTKDNNPILIIDGARQIGKTFIIRDVGKELFENYIELNMEEDFNGDKLYENISTIEDFYFQISSTHGSLLKDKANTLIFIDEIQRYPKLITMLKFLKDDNRYTYICSGSLLGITLNKTSSIPLGSIEIKHMFPLDFEEFLIANGFNENAINILKQHFEKQLSLDENTHSRVLKLFKRYLLVGGLPEAVNQYVKRNNIDEVRRIHNLIYDGYGDDAGKYDLQHKLKIKRIYDMIVSNLEKKKKRVVYNEIDDKYKQRYSYYVDEFDYLIHSGIALEVKAISNPSFPLIESSSKNLIKLYYNDIGIFTNILYRNNINPIINDQLSINLGSVYENVVASELKAHNYNLYYYDNRKNGEVDFIIDDYNLLSIIPIEVKSGKDYSVHSALNKLLSNKQYNINKAYVLSNKRELIVKNNIHYLPIYFVMFL